MALGPRLDLRQSQSLVMTPQLQQAIKLLALSNLEVESFVGEALAANPLLDVADAPDAHPSEPPPLEAPQRQTSLETSTVDRLVSEGRAAQDAPLDMEAAAATERDRDTGDGTGPVEGDASWGSALGSGSSAQDTSFEDRAVRTATLAEHLDAQIGAIGAGSVVTGIARYIVALLDEAGYLPAPLEDVAHDLGVSRADAESALALVQSLDPTGVGATSLAECIALQAREVDRLDPAMACLIENLDLVARGDIARLKRACGVDDEDLADMLAELRGYDPKPGLRFGGDPSAPVVPDVIVEPGADGGWNIALNRETLPRLVVNRDYYLEMRDSCVERTARGWLSERLADANWLIKALDQRQKTILKVSAELVKQQEGFFRHGVSHLRPLTLRCVADAVGVHESTVSRVTSNKYLHCQRGTFELKFFFTSGVAAADGEGAISAEAVKDAIRRLIEAEDPKSILSDDALVERLRQQGFDLARRTVAKYREAIGIGSSVQRRRQKALASTRK